MMNTIKKINNISLSKTIYANFKLLPLKKAFHFPIVCGRGVVLDIQNKHGLSLADNGKLKIGIGGSFKIAHSKTFFHIGKNGKVIVQGSSSLCKGTQLVADGELTIGNNFGCNANCLINCGQKMYLSENSLLGWNATVMDGDGHNMISNGELKPKYSPVYIGDHTWLAAHATVLKGSRIGNDSVVAYGGIVSAKYEEDALLLGGVNKVLKKNINWKM